MKGSKQGRDPYLLIVLAIFLLLVALFAHRLLYLYA